jgi:hypothetical protein
MLKVLSIVLFCTTTFTALAQEPSRKYQSGTITAVTTHSQDKENQSSDIARYDVSVKVGNTEYVVLYTPPNGAKSVEYSVGFDLLVLVGSDTLTFNSKLSGETVVPILRRTTLAPQEGLDLSKVPGQYFRMKLQNLTESLNLSEDQRTKIQPILEQETAEVKEFWGNPVISQKDKLKRWEKIVRSSDAKMKPLVSQVQWENLESMRKEQKQELKSLIADQKGSTQR